MDDIKERILRSAVFRVDVGNSPESVTGKERAFPGLSVIGWPRKVITREEISDQNLRYLEVDVGNSPESVIGKKRAFQGLSVFGRTVITRKGLRVLPNGVGVGAVLPLASKDNQMDTFTFQLLQMKVLPVIPDPFL
ncbi:hypothetical protein CEXT_158601 [Caerostris extrusa]|uniref:Uncharacterized protein n=1 Tax=Caerostris extrusa TaxID=172846 RepID=A0AAV4UKN7_CAEEX|nr:hypothetical protein CEXT_158601 [Caerostris extrusa]